jgi:hypothetical protein
MVHLEIRLVVTRDPVLEVSQVLNSAPGGRLDGTYRTNTLTIVLDK